MQIRSRHDLVAQGLLVPTSMDWQIRFVFTDDTERTVRVSPGRLTEELAILRAKRHAAIFDETVLKDVTATRVAKTTNVAQYGIVQK